MAEDVFDMVPVLHQQTVGVVDNGDFNRREEVVVVFLVAARY
jgi:hypothetical protein